MNQALKPYWPILWRAAARGRWCTVTVIRCCSTAGKAVAEHPLGPTAISSVFEGGFVLSFATGSDGDLAMLVTLPEARQTMYEIGPWPMDYGDSIDAPGKWDTSRAEFYGTWPGRPLVFRLHGDGINRSAGVGSLSGFGHVRVHGRGMGFASEGFPPGLGNA